MYETDFCKEHCAVEEKRAKELLSGYLKLNEEPYADFECAVDIPGGEI